MHFRMRATPIATTAIGRHLPNHTADTRGARKPRGRTRTITARATACHRFSLGPHQTSGRQHEPTRTATGSRILPGGSGTRGARGAGRRTWQSQPGGPPDRHGPRSTCPTPAPPRRRHHVTGTRLRTGPGHLTQRRTGASRPRPRGPRHSDAPGVSVSAPEQLPMSTTVAAMPAVGTAITHSPVSTSAS